MGDLRVGDSVVDPLGFQDSRVLAIFHRGLQPVYRLWFSDDSHCEATADHLWCVEAHSTAFGYQPVTATTEQLQERLRKRAPKKPRTRLITVQVRIAGSDPLPLNPNRELVEIKYTRITPVQCIVVSAPGCLYFTDGYIPTHNSTVRTET